MNTKELRAERVRKGKSILDMATALNITRDAYSRRERGVTKFSAEQMAKVAKELELTIDKTNLIFFGNELPIGKLEKLN